ncbi:MAG: hypothetical protein ACE14T_10090 [Syntrophales bacterium]
MKYETMKILFKKALSKSLTSCKDSRFQVAAKISELANHNISKDILDKYTSRNEDYEIRAVDLPAFCLVTKTIKPFSVLVAPLGCNVLNPEDSKHLKLAKLLQQQKSLAIEIARTEAELGIKR